ncbi:MAG: hypothetical protein Q4C42_06480 [Clostridia bacterium]|nr:hypothetical protein [Clostridia bacterium]
MKRFISLILAVMLIISCTAVSASAAVGAIQNDPKYSTSSSSTMSKLDKIRNMDIPEGSFVIKPIDWDTAVMGQYACFNGYSDNRIIDNCTQSTSLGMPIRTSVILSNDDKNSRMMYYYGETFLERVSSTSPYYYHSEGQLDAFCIFNHYYTDASGYCDELAYKWQPDAQYYKNEDMSFYDSQLDARRQNFYDEVYPGMANYGMSLDWFDVTAAQKVYTYENYDGETYAMCIMVEDFAYQYTSSGYGVTNTEIQWFIPAYYILWCPLKDYQEIHDNEFMIFAENTRVNDEMIALNDKITYQIRDTVINEMNMMCAASMAYAEAMTALTFEMVESSMSYGTYSSDSFSDYLFDQNDYTLSDGSSVKVSTGYDYVWEGSNGTIYYGNSLLDEPGGATLLYPN